MLPAWHVLQRKALQAFPVYYAQNILCFVCVHISNQASKTKKNRKKYVSQTFKTILLYIYEGL